MSKLQPNTFIKEHYLKQMAYMFQYYIEHHCYPVREIVVDNFAGGGGASTGIEMAIGHSVDIAINHDPQAIAMHQANHPYTKHYCESVWDVNPLEACQGKPVGLAWFSPDCKHFSKAKGGKPVDKNIRGLAWIVLKWAALVRPRVIMLENVEEFQTWGPINRRHRPIKSKRGQTYLMWRSQLEALGYKVETRELIAADYGAPTKRKRFFMIARCDGRPIIWPEATHAPRDSEEVKAGLMKAYVPAADVIDWSLPCPSIFDTSKEIKAKYGLSAVRPLADNTMKRIARGLQKFVVDNPEPFIIQVNHSGENFRGQDIKEPMPTLTAKHGFGVVSPYMVPIGYGEREGQAPRVNDIQNPLGTIVSKEKHFLCTPYITQIGQTGFTQDRNKSMEDPLTTIVSKNEHCLIAPTLIQYHTEITKNEARGQEINQPVMTIDGSPRYGLISAFISKYYDGNYKGAGSSCDDPLHTVTAVDHNSIVTTHIIQMNNNMIGTDMREPLNTIVAGPGHIGEVRAFLIKYYGQGTGQDIKDPLDTVVSKDRFGLVTIHGQDYQIVDIGLRMLEPKELYAAQGFPKDYIINKDLKGNTIDKSEQVKRCGNAVPPPFAKALVRSNLPEYTGERRPNMRVDDSKAQLKFA
jgi:DNA (cytosine-5)-methyltransferase 1